MNKKICSLRLCVNFHYSDFWADPSAQKAPKAWEGYSILEKAAAISDFTQDCLQKIRNAGGQIGIVQIGNEINNGLYGETSQEQIIALLRSASAAVRSIDPSIAIAVHYTDIHKDGFSWYADNLKAHQLDYDIFGISYYPYWHGPMTNLSGSLEAIAERSGKKTLVFETAYPYTLNDGDGYRNTVGADLLVSGYPATVQGQADCLRDILSATYAGGGLGVFYWEPTWIPVGKDPDANKALWELYGSGWASSYAFQYDPDNAGMYYGGSGWDNQALFDHSGTALASLDVFHLIFTGARAK